MHGTPYRVQRGGGEKCSSEVEHQYRIPAELHKMPNSAPRAYARQTTRGLAARCRTSAGLQLDVGRKRGYSAKDQHWVSLHKRAHERLTFATFSSFNPLRRTYRSSVRRTYRSDRVLLSSHIMANVRGAGDVRAESINLLQETVATSTITCTKKRT